MFNVNELERDSRTGNFSANDIEAILPDLEKLKPNDIYLEIGVHFGKSLSVARMVTNSHVKVIGVDLKEDPNVEGTMFYQGNSQEVAKIYDKAEISLLFIDGDHTYKGVKKDIESWYPFVKKDGVIFFHDCDDTGISVMRAVLEFADTHTIKNIKFFKESSGKNSSMCRIEI